MRMMNLNTRAEAMTGRVEMKEMTTDVTGYPDNCAEMLFRLRPRICTAVVSVTVF